LIKFQEYHQQLELNLNQEKEIKERLMTEIKSNNFKEESEEEILR